jgi:hypothetical protein
MATKNYEIGIWWNGIGWNAVVRGWINELC